jgi:hypothetical protein
MDKYEIMSLMMRDEPHPIRANLYSISALLAEGLAHVADRLSDDEMKRFIDIGTALYRRGMDEFVEGVPVHDLFPVSGS